jgi:hypothetical protein
MTTGMSAPPMGSVIKTPTTREKPKNSSITWGVDKIVSAPPFAETTT